MELTYIRLIPAGDSAMLVKTGNDISPQTNLLVRQMHHILLQMGIEGITEFVPAYNTLMVYYQPSLINYQTLRKKIHLAELQISSFELPRPHNINVPVCYGGDYGPDLSWVAAYNGISEEEVIKIHTQSLYTVYMLGFTPGFCYLGGLQSQISCPRKETPRMIVPAGSVGIAGTQTGIYPIESPGGWQIIGKTPLLLFRPWHQHPFLMEAGNTVQFYAVNPDEFQKTATQVALETMEPQNKEQ